MKKALGRGLESLISGTEQREIRQIQLKLIKPNPFQPRKHFTEEDLSDMTESIKANGVLHPITVRRKNDFFEIVAGERRYRASIFAGLKDIPAIIKEVTDEKMLEFSLIENIQRKDLNPIDEAFGYRDLAEKFKMTHETISKRIGKSRSYITNMLRILELETHIRKMISENILSMGHAKVLLSIKDKNKRIIVAQKIAKENLSVRNVENLLSGTIIKSRIKEKIQEHKSTHLKSIENKLSEHFSRKAEIKYKKGKGRISLDFYSDDDLMTLLEKFGLKNLD
ncbi:MAG: chromosome partitioning protein ParB [bacterium (Candidatus Stahlbacteria) CG23_combo_of_CG06-09_8_20_14_all_34_7]|nr:MAG: chromosome partitioning protein ParB [bacterium (Candidatus Stahlbacteria) CG23_combo_of_CG06-09_8_20_14_all_34_7]